MTAALAVMVTLFVFLGCAPTTPSPTPSAIATGEVELTAREIGDRVLPPPPTAPYPGVPWTMDGRQVDTGVIALAPGPEHCGWESSLFLTMGWPLGRIAETSLEARLYLRDPEGIHAPALTRGRFAGDVALPEGAFHTGYRYGPDELWVDVDTVDREVYLVRGDVVERWSRASELLGCD
ncbi:MAG TPA: hypothetical protein VD763_03195 [Candidatus Saccharimonadales bacterium]|nr:hypothetical protein [Candidatus Saccharimonadales bacterium]